MDSNAYRDFEAPFGELEEEMLRIKIIETDDLLEIFSVPGPSLVPDYLKHLELEHFGVSDILTFVPHEHPRLSRSQRLFLRRIQDVLLNRLDTSSRLQLHIRDLADLFIKECKLEDGLVLYARESMLSLRIGSRKYRLFADKEGRSSEEIIWIIQESKYKSDPRYKKGDVQVVASMIAACQSNYVKRKGVLVRKVLYGIKVIGEEFYFYRIDFEVEYLKQIARHSLPTSDLIVHKYPCGYGLRIGKSDHRKTLLCLMHRLRDYALYNTSA